MDLREHETWVETHGQHIESLKSGSRKGVAADEMEARVPRRRKKCGRQYILVRNFP
jgi:hypothetical protein